MSLLYGILKPFVRKVVKGSSLHQEESYEEFKQASYDAQKKFKFRLPSVRSFEFRDEQLDGFHIIVGKKTGSDPNRAVVYFSGGGSGYEYYHLANETGPGTKRMIRLRQHT